MTVVVRDQGQNNEIRVPQKLAGAGLKIKVRGDENRIVLEAGVIARGATISVKGDGNVIHVGERTTIGPDRVGRALWKIEGSGNSLLLGRQCWFNPRVQIYTNDGTVDVGAETTSYPGSLNLRESGTISIGRDCQFAAGWWIADSDMHPIYDRSTGERINPGGDVIIGAHVWLGSDVQVLKGATIGEGCVIGAGARVTGVVPPHCLAIGSPARVQRENIRWERKFDSGGQRVAGSTLGRAELTVLESNRD